jgi:hypothetical protein
MSNIRDQIQEDFPDVPLLFMDNPENYDKAIIGVIEGAGVSAAVAYDYEKVINANIDQGMTEEEAIEHFEFNQLGAYVGEHTPVFVHNYNKGEENDN